MSLHARASTAGEVFRHFLAGKGHTIKPSCRPGQVEVWPGAHRGDVIWLLDTAEYQKLRDLMRTEHWRCEHKENGRLCGEPASCIDTRQGCFICDRHNAVLLRQIRREAGKLQAA